MNIENVLSVLQDQGLTNHEIRLIEEVTKQTKTNEAPPKLGNVEGERLKVKSNKIHTELNLFQLKTSVQQVGC